MAELLNVDKAVELILAEIPSLPPETVSLENSAGRILAEDVISEIDLPAFPNSAMDGYAVRAADTAGASREAPVEVRIIEDIPAGKAPEKTLQPGDAARIMTGAPVPPGADAVIPVEDTSGAWDNGRLPDSIQLFRSVNPGDYVRPTGENIQRGQTILSAGTMIRSAEIGILAALGLSRVSVIRRPRVVILSSGSELAEPGQPLAPGQIYDANSYMLAAMVAENGGEPVRLPIAKDTLDDLRSLFRQALDEKPDLLISSAGVSVGAADFTRTILSELGEVGFWRLNLRPGKPLAFGRLAGIPFFGLPGNPVSAAVTFEILVRPALLKMAGKPDDSIYETAVLGERLKSDGRRSYLRVTLTREDGELVARTTGSQSSGALMSMVTADALMIVPEDVTEVEPGTRLRVKLLKPIPQGTLQHDIRTS